MLENQGGFEKPQPANPEEVAIVLLNAGISVNADNDNLLDSPKPILAEFQTTQEAKQQESVSTCKNTISTVQQRFSAIKNPSQENLNELKYKVNKIFEIAQEKLGLTGKNKDFFQLATNTITFIEEAQEKVKTQEQAENTKNKILDITIPPIDLTQSDEIIKKSTLSFVEKNIRKMKTSFFQKEKPSLHNLMESGEEINKELEELKKAGFDSQDPEFIQLDNQSGEFIKDGMNFLLAYHLEKVVSSNQLKTPVDLRSFHIEEIKKILKYTPKIEGINLDLLQKSNLFDSKSEPVFPPKESEQNFPDNIVSSISPKDNYTPQEIQWTSTSGVTYIPQNEKALNQAQINYSENIEGTNHKLEKTILKVSGTIAACIMVVSIVGNPFPSITQAKAHINAANTPTQSTTKLSPQKTKRQLFLDYVKGKTSGLVNFKR